MLSSSKGIRLAKCANFVLGVRRDGEDVPGPIYIGRLRGVEVKEVEEGRIGWGEERNESDVDLGSVTEEVDGLRGDWNENEDDIRVSFKGVVDAAEPCRILRIPSFSEAESPSDSSPESSMRMRISFDAYVDDRGSCAIDREEVEGSSAGDGCARTDSA